MSTLALNLCKVQMAISIVGQMTIILEKTGLNCRTSDLLMWWNSYANFLTRGVFDKVLNQCHHGSVILSLSLSIHFLRLIWIMEWKGQGCCCRWCYPSNWNLIKSCGGRIDYIQTITGLKIHVGRLWQRWQLWQLWQQWQRWRPWQRWQRWQLWQGER